MKRETAILTIRVEFPEHLITGLPPARGKAYIARLFSEAAQWKWMDERRRLLRRKRQ